MQNPVISRAFDFSDGVNRQSAVTNVRETETRTSENVQIDQDGVSLFRYGISSIIYPDATFVVGTGIFYYEPDTGTAQVIKTAGNAGSTDFAFLSLDSGTWTPITESGFTFANHIACQGLMANQLLYVAARGGSNRVMRYNGTGVVQIATSPVCQGLAYFKRRLFAWGDTSAPHTLYFTATGDLENWMTSDSGSLTVAVGDGDEIVSVKALYDRLIVLKTDSFYVVEGNDHGTFRLVEVFSEDCGCAAAGSVVQIENLLYYMGRDKVYATDGTSVTSVSDSVQSILANRARASDPYVFAVHHRKRNMYMLFYGSPGGTDLDVALVFKYKSSVGGTSVNAHSGWTTFVSFSPVQAGMSFRNAVSKLDLVYLVGADSNLYAFETYDNGAEITEDDGVAVTGVVRSRWDDGGDISLSKRLRRMFLVFSTSAPSGRVALVRYVNLGVPACKAYQFLVSGARTGNITLQVFTDFDESTVRQTRTITPPTGVTFNGLMRGIVQMQITAERGQEA